MATPYGFGWKKDAPDPRDFDSQSKFGTGVAADVTVSYRDEAGEPLNQFATESCVWHATPKMAQLAAKLRGLEIELPSRMFGYYNARKLEDTLAPVLDEGSYPRLAFKALAQFGFCPESAWPFDPGLINEPPPVGAYRLAYDQRWLGNGGGYYSVTAVGSARRAQIQASLLAKGPLTVGLQIDESFFDLPADAYYGMPTGQIVGGHDVGIVGCTPKGVEIINSWGTSWGDFGFGFVSWDMICSAFTHDIWSVDIVPDYSEKTP